MQHTYKVYGMTCNGCKNHVEQVLNDIDGVSKASVNLEKEEAVVDMESHIPIEDFQKVFEDEGGSYTIATLDDDKAEERQQQQKEERRAQMPKGATYYCPMHCEGDKTYDEPGDCPVDRKSTRLNSSHVRISYAVFCLKKKKRI